MKIIMLGMKNLHKAKLATLTLCVIFIGCSISQNTKSYQEQLIGVWNLKTVNRSKPNTMNIKSLKIEFFEDGKWICTEIYSGDYEGKQRQQQGKYKISGSSIEFIKTNNLIVMSWMKIENELLTLAPDPNIKPDENTLTTYELAK